MENLERRKGISVMSCVEGAITGYHLFVMCDILNGLYLHYCIPAHIHTELLHTVCFLFHYSYPVGCSSGQGHVGAGD